MNWRAASFTRAEREKLVLRSSSTSTKTRPLNSLLLLRTSGSTGLVLKSGGSNFSTGMSTSEAIETDLRLAPFEDLEVVFGEVADEVALLVGDDRVDLDVVDLDLEGNRRLVGRGLGRRGLLGPQSPMEARREAVTSRTRTRSVRPGVWVRIKSANVQTG